MPPSISTTSSERAKGTKGRAESLPTKVLKRDKHKCVITGHFNLAEYLDRAKPDFVEPALDDDGNPISMTACGKIEVAHILPHSLMAAMGSSCSGAGPRSGSALSEMKRVTIALLQMFKPDILSLIDGSLIDTPANALSLRSDFHFAFGMFHIYFAPLYNHAPYTHVAKGFTTTSARWLQSVDEERFIQHGPDTGLKVILRSTKSSSAPSNELFRLHEAIGRMHRLSAAGYVADDVQRDMEDVSVPACRPVGVDHRVSRMVMTWLKGVCQSEVQPCALQPAQARPMQPLVKK